eukprot:scaffold29286_cov54-Cyclotella_meneghiniana.AAC.3
MNRCCVGRRQHSFEEQPTGIDGQFSRCAMMMMMTMMMMMIFVKSNTVQWGAAKCNPPGNRLTTATTITSPNFVNIQLQLKPQEVNRASFTPAIDCKSH